jgi:hypothetical protein
MQSSSMHNVNYYNNYNEYCYWRIHCRINNHDHDFFCRCDDNNERRCRFNHFFIL